MQEGRHASGGWPGTLSEARTRLQSVIGGARLSPDVRRKLVQILYDAAKTTWLESRDRSRSRR